MFSIVSIAQNKKVFVGNYRENDASYFIQNDNTFIIVAYATLITGKWREESDNVLKLSPKNPDFPFLLYGYHNPSIVGTKIMFSGFDNDETFVGLNKRDSMQRVFNENVNCKSFPNVHLFDKAAKEVSFSCGVETNKGKERKTYTYKIDNNFNDFVAVYISQSNFREPIILKIKKDGLENRFGEKLSKIKELNNEDTQMIKEINKAVEAENNVEYYNPSYNHISASKITLKRYIFNKSKNAYVLKKHQNSDNAYHDLNVVYKYSRVGNLQIKDEKVLINEKTLFHFECGE